LVQIAAAPKDAPKTAEHATQAISDLDLEPELKDLLSDNSADDQSISHEWSELFVSVEGKKSTKPLSFISIPIPTPNLAPALLIISSMSESSNSQKTKCCPSLRRGISVRRPLPHDQ
jgi:hypothetical protein